MTKHDDQLKSDKMDEAIFLFFDIMPVAFRNVLIDELDTIKFWLWSIVLLIPSVAIIQIIIYIPNSSYILGGCGIPDIPYITPFFDYPVLIDGFFNFKISLHNKEILSTLAQVQAAIFGVWFALIFLIYSIQISNKAGSPEQIKRHLSSKSFKFVFFIFIMSLTLDVVMLKYADFEINLFWILSLSIYAILLLYLYVYKMLINVSNAAIREEVLSKHARHDLKGSNLSLMDLSDFDLNNRDLTNCNLSYSNLSRTNFNSATFHRTNLRHATLNGANLKRANLTQSNLESTNFSGADLNRTTFGMDGDLLKGSWCIIILHIMANNTLFKRIMCDPIKKRVNLIDQESKSEEEMSIKYLEEFVNLIRSSRPARLFLKLIIILFRRTVPKASHLNVTYDENTLNSLLNAKNLDKAEFYGTIKKDLIEKSKETINDPDIDLDLDESLKRFLVA